MDTGDNFGVKRARQIATMTNFATLTLPGFKPRLIQALVLTTRWNQNMLNEYYLFMCKTFAGGNPLKQVDDA